MRKSNEWFKRCKTWRNNKLQEWEEKPSENGTVPIYGGNGILGYTNISNYSECIIIGRVGVYCGSVYYEEKRCWISDNAIAAIPMEGLDVYYAYYLLKSLHLNHRHTYWNESISINAGNIK